MRLTEFDQSTIANMTAALEHVCKKIPSDRDTHELRKQIADEIIACARAGSRTLIDFQDAGSQICRGADAPRPVLVVALAEALAGAKIGLPHLGAAT